MNSVAIFATRFLRIDGRAATYCYFCYSFSGFTSLSSLLTRRKSIADEMREEHRRRVLGE
jgi:hypothetical protein